MITGSDVILERMMTLHPKVIDLTLGRVDRLLAALGNPERRLPPVVHIAGTNGKGSTQAMIRAGLEAGGETVHAYTSPHLARFHERIRLAGELITEPALTALLDECVRKNGPDEITFFEITTCAAFLAFARTPADWTLLEVGLGGRLDATNVVEKPRLTIITPVSLDHQSFLGDTVAAIAGEKAGIIKRGVPVIVGPQHPDGLDVIEDKAARLGAPVVELHTGLYSELLAEGHTALADQELAALRKGARLAGDFGLEVHAGHGLTYDNVEAIAAIPEVMELNIGHFLIGEAIFRGLGPAIEEMRRRMDAARGVRP